MTILPFQRLGTRPVGTRPDLRRVPLWRWLSCGLALFGGSLIGRWIFQWEGYTRLLAGSPGMGLVAPLEICLAGLCLLIHPRTARTGPQNPFGWLATPANSLVLLFSAAMLVEHVTGQPLGVDLRHADAMPSEVNPNPGRMSPNACLAFFLAGIALWQLRLRRRPWLVLMASGACAGIGAAALLGYFLHLEVLYQLANVNRLFAPTALAIATLGSAIWMAQRDHLNRVAPAVLPSGQRIVWRALAVVALVATVSGVFGFSIMRDTFESALLKDLELVTSTNAASLDNSLDSALWFPKTLATRPSVSKSLETLDANPDDADAKAFLGEVGRSFFSAGLTAARFYNARDVLVVQVGSAVQPLVILKLKADAQEAELIWKDGFLLRTSNTVTLGSGATLGRVVTEQPLPAFDSLLTRVRDANDSSDALLCGRDGDDANCAPTRFYGAPFRIPMRKPDGSLNLPINRALEGQSGVEIATDLRGTPVIAGYSPIDSYGIGLVIKTNLQTAYAPLRSRADALLLGLLGLIAIGTLAIRGQVYPLVARLSNEQRRSAIILENSSDAFIAIDGHGVVTDWSARAQMLFEWSSSEALGRSVTDLLIAGNAQAGPRSTLAGLLQAAGGPAQIGMLELSAVSKSGRVFPIELSVATFHDGESDVATLLARDISARSAAANQLAASEKRLRAITDNLPVVIFYIDRDHIVRFANQTVRVWMGIDPEFALGKTLGALLSPDLYAHRRPFLDRALAGEHVEFESVSVFGDDSRHIQTTYIPDGERGPDGRVNGVYALASDVSALKAVEKHLEAVARLDPLTGLANRRHFEEKFPEAVARSQRWKRPIAVMLLDIDHFKRINDTHGHAVGDAVLREFSARLRSAVRAVDTVARLGGDEFVVILEGLNHRKEAALVAEKIGARLGEQFLVGKMSLQVSASIGVAFVDDGDRDVGVLLEKADLALYRAKDAGRNTFALTTV
ncbi:MAG: diguanylate cyclase [Pseudomonadota bacterium]|nr:diguanylate cyclase [Pseudomonadota bacterium]